MKYLPIVILASAVASGCSTYSASRYSISTDNVIALRSLNGQTVSVGSFSGTGDANKSEIMCRGVGPIKTPDSEAFPEYVRKALLDELRIANVHSSSAPVTLTGNLDSIDFSSNSGNWNLALTVKSSNGKSLSLTESYKYTSSSLLKFSNRPAVLNKIAQLEAAPK